MLLLLEQAILVHEDERLNVPCCILAKQRNLGQDHRPLRHLRLPVLL
jgi:hypothetical protein